MARCIAVMTVLCVTLSTFSATAGEDDSTRKRNAPKPEDQNAYTHARDGETLYNGIRLSKEWPPRYDRNPRDPMPVPYLDEPPAVIPIDVGRQLFVDDFLIEEADLSRELHRPEYHEANPVIKPDKPWENKSVGWFAAPFSGGAWYDPADDLFKIWYTGGVLASSCLATSRDGIHWEKPPLPLVVGPPAPRSGPV